MVACDAMLAGLNLGAIDAGSNGIRVVIGSLSANGLVRLESDRVAVRLGTGTFTRGEMPAEIIDQAVAAFVSFRQMFDRHGVTRYRAVATSAVRNASNRDVLLHRLVHEAQIELDVIEGDEEARLVRKATLNAFAQLANNSGAAAPPIVPPRTILDLGGGSLEINLQGATTWKGFSLPIGTVRLLESFGLTGILGDSEAGMVRRYVATMMRSILPLQTSNLAMAAVTGGNAEAIAKICGEPAAPGVMPWFEVAALEHALPEILGLTVDERMERFAIRRDRAEVIGVAALIFATVGRQLGIARMVAPGVGVREAVLLELAESEREYSVLAVGAKDKSLLTAARAFMHRVDHDDTHAEQVRMLSRSIFRQLRDVHGLPDSYGVTLELAALLHDVGEVVNTSGHHKHSEYLIRNARIAGLTDEHRNLVAVCARAHRKSAADAKRAIADSSLSKELRIVARRLAALLRLADSLDSEHRQRVEQLVCARVGTAVVFDLVVRDGPSRDDETLLRKADLFREEFGLEVRLTVGSTPEAMTLPVSAGVPSPN